MIRDKDVRCILLNMECDDKNKRNTVYNNIGVITCHSLLRIIYVFCL